MARMSTFYLQAAGGFFLFTFLQRNPKGFKVLTVVCTTDLAIVWIILMEFIKAGSVSIMVVAFPVGDLIKSKHKLVPSL